MPAYVILDVSVHDPATYDRYKAVSGATLAAHGGRFIVRGGRTETLEGGWEPERLIMLQFESMEAAKRWYDSEEYREPKKLRHVASRGRMVLVEGC
jgi:uncharacterized protein (DUF1330 family)